MKRKVYFAVRETAGDGDTDSSVTRVPGQFSTSEEAWEHANQQPMEDGWVWVMSTWINADETADGAEVSVEKLDTSPARRLEIYENLHDILSDMIEDGRLRREDFQQDYDAIVDLLQSPELAS
jgi:hypothetical protein